MRNSAMCSVSKVTNVAFMWLNRRSCDLFLCGEDDSERGPWGMLGLGWPGAQQVTRESSQATLIPTDVLVGWGVSLM